jgi:hypothetical protein
MKHLAAEADGWVSSIQESGNLVISGKSSQQ